MTDRVADERLVELLTWLGDETFAGFKRTCNLPVAEAKALVSELLALREAMKPFAEYGKTFLPADPSDQSVWATASADRKVGSIPVTIGDFRRAARTIIEEAE